jgi:hypothetical protein
VKCNSGGYHLPTEINKEVSSKQFVLKYTKMAARQLQDEILQVTDSDVQDSATVTGQDTQPIFLVTNNDNDIHGTVQMQDMLADVLSTLSSIQSQNTRAND